MNRTLHSPKRPAGSSNRTVTHSSTSPRVVSRTTRLDHAGHVHTTEKVQPTLKYGGPNRTRRQAEEVVPDTSQPQLKRQKTDPLMSPTQAEVPVSQCHCLVSVDTTLRQEALLNRRKPKLGHWLRSGKVTFPSSSTSYMSRSVTRASLGVVKPVGGSLQNIIAGSASSLWLSANHA